MILYQSIEGGKLVGLKAHHDRGADASPGTPSEVFDITT